MKTKMKIAKQVLKSSSAGDRIVDLVVEGINEWESVKSKKREDLNTLGIDRLKENVHEISVKSEYVHKFSENERQFRKRATIKLVEDIAKKLFNLKSVDDKGMVVFNHGNPVWAEDPRAHVTEAHVFVLEPEAYEGWKREAEKVEE